MKWNDLVEGWGKLNHSMWTDEQSLIITIGLFAAVAVLWLFVKATGR